MAALAHTHWQVRVLLVLHSRHSPQMLPYWLHALKHVQRQATYRALWLTWMQPCSFSPEQTDCRQTPY